MFLQSSQPQIPRGYALTVTGGEGSTLCTTPGLKGAFTIKSSSSSTKVGKVGIAFEVPCESDQDYQYAYQYLYKSSDPEIPPGPKDTFSIYTLGNTDDQRMTAQFCWDPEQSSEAGGAEYSGNYKLYALDGSTQAGTWTQSQPGPNQLVIDYTDSLAAMTCQPASPDLGDETTILGGLPTPVNGSETANEIQCYEPSVTFINIGNVWSDSSGSFDCKAYPDEAGAYICTGPGTP